MKKKILVLTMALALALGFSACGNKTVESGNSTTESGKASDAETFKDEGSDNKSSEDSSEDTSLSDWYEGSDRKTVENLINNMFSGQGLKFFITLEAQDVLGYNYQYTEQLEVSDALKEGLAEGVDSGAAVVISDIQNYRDTYGVTLNGIHMAYLNADGSVIYEQDITEDYEPSTSGDSTLVGVYDDLQAWMESDEAAQMVEVMNNALTSTGMTIDFSADGNIFVYEYYMSDEAYQSSGLGNYSDAELQSYIESVAESQRASIESVFSEFDNNYGLTLDAVRVAFYKADGTFIVSTDILNDIY